MMCITTPLRGFWGAVRRIPKKGGRSTATYPICAPLPPYCKTVVVTNPLGPEAHCAISASGSLRYICFSNVRAFNTSLVVGMAGASYGPCAEGRPPLPNPGPIPSYPSWPNPLPRGIKGVGMLRVVLVCTGLITRKCGTQSVDGWSGELVSLQKAQKGNGTSV